MSVDTEKMTDEELLAIWRAITAEPPVVVTSHVRLDGDAVGAALALWHALQGFGVDSTVAFQPPTPAMFDFLPGMDQVVGQPSELPDCFHLVVVDCGNYARVGELGRALAVAEKTVNIDHHDTNTYFGDLNYVDGDSSSSGEMVHRLLRVARVPMTEQIAECLFTAVVTDTGQFSHEDTSPEAFRVCAECVAAGARPHELIRKLFFSPSPAQMKLRHLALGSLRFHHGGRIATMEVTEQMFERTGLGPIDTEGFADVPIAVRGVAASALLKEMPDRDYIKVSMRGKDAVDVCEVARSFGGGGHKHAAGCEIADALEAVRGTVVQRLVEQLERDGSPDPAG